MGHSTILAAVVPALLLGVPAIDTFSNRVVGTARGKLGVVDSIAGHCLETATLEELTACIVLHMPPRNSDGFVVPTNLEQTDWRTVARQMLEGQCEGIVLPDSLGNIFALGRFDDQGSEQSYCVLVETLDENADGIVDRGWGTFITNANATRELSIQIAHPLADEGTEHQGIGVFKGVQARSFIMAGTHRRANRAPSTCQPTTLEADVAHNVANLFQPTVLELRDFYEAVGIEFVGMQFHGMNGEDPETCPGVHVYLTYGRPTPPAPGDKLLDLKLNLLAYHPDWVVTVPGDEPPCDRHGSTNVQGRFLNDVAPGSVCTRFASQYTGRFIHIEQKPGYRTASDWIEAINATWP